MAYGSRVFRILIASPSDVEEEREIAVRAIQEWNDLYSYSRKVTLLPLRWETHTAPEYGMRPQEVINRAIVDDCDMLVGVFWTRLGSPTGVADSGTLEEIERVANVGKPVMLYFSRVGADPEQINSDQIAKLKQFKTKTYPNGLVESYKTHIEFRDKFTRQLELKVRELQRRDASGEVPLALEFLSIETGAPVGNRHSRAIEFPHVTDFRTVPKDQRQMAQQLVRRYIEATTYVPITLAITNSAASGVRNLYVELDLSASSARVAVTDSPIGVPFERYIDLFAQVYTHQGRNYRGGKRFSGSKSC